MSRKRWKELLGKAEYRYYYIRENGIPVVTVCMVKLPRSGSQCVRGIAACHPKDDPPSKAKGRTHAKANANRAWFHGRALLASRKQDEEMLKRLSLIKGEDAPLWKQMNKGKILGLPGVSFTRIEAKRFRDWHKKRLQFNRENKWKGDKK